MNEQTAEVIKSLADKLGTTSEYLWSVLIKQAPIDGWISVLDIVLVAATALALVRGSYFLFTKVRDDNWDEITYVWVGLAGLGVFILAIITIVCINSVITAFVNPEYWALNHVLDAIKRR